MIIVQSDWQEAFSAGETAWVTLQCPGQPSVHGQLEAPVAGGGERATGFWACRPDDNSLLVGHPDADSDYLFRAPSADFSNIHAKAVIGMDATTGGLTLSCAADDSLRIWETDTGAVRRELSGHLGEATTARWFPSGVVALTGGVDMQLRVWSAETGQCAAVLRGHTAALTDTAIVLRGRNVVSTARDGRCKLWDVGKQQCLADLHAGTDIINCVLLTDLPDGVDAGTRQQPDDEREVGTAGRLVALGTDAGTLHLLHAHTRHQLSSWQLPAAVTSLAAAGPHQLVAGCGDGGLHWLDVRRPGAAAAAVQRRSRAAVLALLAQGGGAAVLAARADGTTAVETPDRQPQTLCLSGPDCDPVHALSAVPGGVLTASRDGHVRRYRL